MKKILIYVNSMAPAGGIERVVANLSNEWSKNYEIIIVTKDNNKSFYKLNEDIKIRNLNIPLTLNMKNRISRMVSIGKNLISTQLILRKAIKEEGADYIYTTSPLNSLEVSMLGKKYRNRLVISEHGSKFGYNKVYNFIKKIIYPKAYKIVVPTTTDHELYLKEGFPSIYIPHICTFKAEEKNQLNSKIVLNIGRLTNDKQQIKLLKIWNLLNKDNEIDGWKLRIVGRGEELESLNLYIVENKLEDNVEIVEPVKHVEKIFQDADIFAFTSKFEGFGMVLLEAMSFGVPCISFNCPSGPKDIIKNEENGFLIEPDDIQEFSNKIKIMMTNSDERKNMGSKAFDTVKGWDNEHIMKQWDELFGGY